MRGRLQSIPISYPRLPDILDEETLAAVATLESKERSFARAKGRSRHQYLRAIYLKAFVALGHGHLDPGGIPRQVRLRVAEQLSSSSEFAEILRLDRREKNRVVAAVRAFLKIRPATAAAKTKVEQWLSQDMARCEGDVAALTNAAIVRFRQTKTELPQLVDVSALAQRALDSANRAVEARVSRALNETETTALTALVEPASTTWTELKRPAGAPGVNALCDELARLKQVEMLLPRRSVLALLKKRKMDELAVIAKRYDAAELRQLRPSKRNTALACFVAVRRTELLDDLAEMFIQIWDKTKATAIVVANAEYQAAKGTHDSHRTLLRDLLHIIRANKEADALWRAVHGYSDDVYARTLKELETTKTWSACYYDKLEDHYQALRRFLPKWYASVVLQPTTAKDSTVPAMEFLRSHSLPQVSELPARHAPTGFLTRAWQKRALRRYAKTGEVVRVLKAPYEVGWFEACAASLKTGTVAVAGADRYAPINDHLLDREPFLADFGGHVAKMNHPATASEHYGPLRDTFSDKLKKFDAQYSKNKKQFWMNQDGTLGFSRLAAQQSVRKAEKLSASIGPHMPETSIVDVLLDCHRWTGFMDAFVPVGGRQNMTDAEKIRACLAALYAYGCNCGPTQAARAIGGTKNQIVYVRRHYMGTTQLIDAASRLSDAYGTTKTAERIGSAGVLMSDAMHVRAPKDSLGARTYYRDRSHKNILLYQHVTSHCICRFTQALLCNVSEAIHMLHGVLMCRQGREPLISICDSGGKSDLVFGIASLLNIQLYPRVRSRNLKLWAPDKDLSYEHLPGPFAGSIKWERIEEGWRDMMWVLASISAGTASPVVIFERLAAQRSHPATQGFQELGKLERSSYLVDYGMDLNLRGFVVPHTSRREHWNRFTRDVLAFGDLVREKDHEGQEEVFWFLTVVQNAIVLWNALAIERAIVAARRAGVVIDDDDLKHALPTPIGHISFVGMFDVDLRRRPPFKLEDHAKRASKASEHGPRVKQIT